MKEDIIQKLIEEQEGVISDLQKAIKEREEAADIDEDDTRDADDFAQQEVNKDFIRKFSDQLITADKDLATLKSYKFRQSKNFSPGALVETEKYYFLIGAAVHNIDYNNKQVVSISLKAPVYELNEGKVKGDSMIMGNQKTDILNIS